MEVFKIGLLCSSHQAVADYGHMCNPQSTPPGQATDLPPFLFAKSWDLAAAEAKQLIEDPTAMIQVLARKSPCDCALASLLGFGGADARAFVCSRLAAPAAGREVVSTQYGVQSGPDCNRSVEFVHSKENSSVRSVVRSTVLTPSWMFRGALCLHPHAKKVT